MATKQPGNFDFGKKLAELEAITETIDEGDDLDQAVTKFERGMELAAELKEHLRAVENRVEKIKARFSADSAAPAGAGTAKPSDPDDGRPDPFDVGPQTDLFD